MRQIKKKNKMINCIKKYLGLGKKTIA